MQRYFVYILFNQSRTLYVGMTNDLIRRVGEHRAGKVPGFTAKYNIKMLAHYEAFPTPIAAIEREKQIKGWNRAKKIALVEASNSHWEDLSNHLVERFPWRTFRARLAALTFQTRSFAALRMTVRGGRLRRVEL